jgi:hypothetical protein
MRSLSARHWIFLGLLITIVGTMLLNLSIDVKPSPETSRFYQFIDSLPVGSTIMVSFDHEASALPEIRPLTVAILRHVFSRGHRVIGIALLAEGAGIGHRLLEQTAGEHQKIYGRDYVYLGYQPQAIAAILSMGESIKQTFPTDYFGTLYDSLPMMAPVHDLSRLAGVISIADGSLTTHWIEYGKARFNVPVIAAVTAAMMTTYDPYLASGQLTAMVGGLSGAAQYEELIHSPGSGSRGMLAQTAGHLYVIAMILAGNILYLRSRRRGRGSR